MQDKDKIEEVILYIIQTYLKLNDTVFGSKRVSSGEKSGLYRGFWYFFCSSRRNGHKEYVFSFNLKARKDQSQDIYCKHKTKAVQLSIIKINLFKFTRNTYKSWIKNSL